MYNNSIIKFIAGGEREDSKKLTTNDLLEVYVKSSLGKFVKG